MDRQKEKPRPGTQSKPFVLFTFAILLLSVPVFALVKSKQPITHLPESGFAQKAKAFELEDTKGQPQSLAHHSGKGLFIYFFTPSLSGSRDDLDKINKAYKNNQTRKERFEFIGICTGCSTKTAKKLVDKHQLLFPICPDPKKQTTGAYGIRALPVSLVIANNRTIKFEHIGLIPNMKEKFFAPFEEHLGIRLGIWRFHHGTKEEKEKFRKTLTPEQKTRVFDLQDERIVKIANQVPCICDQKLKLPKCFCNRDYYKAMYRWINFFLEDGSFTEEQISKIVQWKWEGIFRDKEKAKEPKEAKKEAAP